MLVYRDATAQTVTLTVDSQTATVGTPAVSESSGKYTATMPTTGAGVYWLTWENTTAGTFHRERIYWSGSEVAVPVTPQLTAQQVRDAMKLAHTDGAPSIDVKLNNLQILGE